MIESPAARRELRWMILGQLVRSAITALPFFALAAGVGYWRGRRLKLRVVE